MTLIRKFQPQDVKVNAPCTENKTQTLNSQLSQPHEIEPGTSRPNDAVLSSIHLNQPPNVQPDEPPNVQPEIKALFADIKEFVEAAADFSNGNVHNGVDEGNYYGTRMWNNFLRRAVKLGLVELPETQQWLLNVTEDE